MRYAMLLDVWCKIAGSREVVFGETRNLSSSGLLVRTDSVIPDASLVRLSIAWPCLLDDRVPLQLRIVGRVKRSDAQGTAIAILSHSFFLQRNAPLIIDSVRATKR
jgi:hypothetical protein